LRQGINQQIRRMFYAVGYEVKRLVRVRIGNLRLSHLPRGHWRALGKSEVDGLKRTPKTNRVGARASKSSSIAVR
jgi:16S rRNA U516 pseudouridylate synthase RsuA-like enzyme